MSDPSTGKFATTVNTLEATPTAVMVGDVTGDGKLDVVTALNSPGGIEVRPGNGDGTFGVVQSFATDRAFASLALADIDGDGDLDLVLSDGANIFQMLNGQPW